jgi:hypothetical protein
MTEHTVTVQHSYEDVSKSIQTESITKYTRLPMAAKLTGLTQNSDTTAPSGIELYHVQFSLQAASPETFGYTLLIENHDLV